MNISIYAAGMPFDATTIPCGGSLGGSESAAYYMAREFAEQGHTVTVFTSKQGAQSGGNVTYQWHGEMSETHPLGEAFERFSVIPHDVCIIQRHPLGFIRPINSKLNILWLHDLALKRNEQPIMQSLVNIDRVICVSEWHRKQVIETWGVNEENVYATHNGIDYGLFTDLGGAVREPRSLIFTSRPERGLENLVCEGGIMERLPDCHLYVCNYDNTTQAMVQYYKYLYSRCEALPNVTILGHLGKADLARATAKCDIQVYPTAFEDTSCIAVLEAMACGTPWVSFKTGALPETSRGGGAILLDFKGNPDHRKQRLDDIDIERYADAVKGLLGDAQRLESMRKKCLSKKQDWTSAAAAWRDQVFSVMAQKSGDALRLFKHFEHTSDIAAILQSGVYESVPPAMLAEFNRNYDFFINGNFAEHYKAYYEMEANVKGVEYGPEDLQGQARFHATLDILRKHNPSSVLDYGCAHGHYTMNLAKRMPGVKFVGVDITESNIEIARQWATDEGEDERVTFQHGLSDSVTGTYDVIMACEVLEHAPNPGEIITNLMAHLNPGGHILISVPYGPWEALGYYEPENVGWRAHIHHFERQDLHDMFGNQDGYGLVALPANPELGHYIVTFRPSGEPIGEIDYTRKCYMQSPQETLSLCMIVKDGENNLGKCLSRLADTVDEIIIGLDNGTTDSTRAIAEKYGAIVYDIESPIKQGFDNARNKVIAKASCDWIMWVDDDEVVENAQALKKYLRYNQFTGYAIQQHHYSVEPPSLFQTDYPIRVFRNRKGVKFYGHVHEHPELALNKGMGKVIALQDVHIAHMGYSLESIRRKRFSRNWPLMQIDRQRHPERTLGKYLWARDLSHVIRYQMERNGGAVSQEIVDMAQEIIGTWRELVKNKEVRLAGDCLSYYSHAVSVLGIGLEYAVNLEVAPQGVSLNGGARAGKFADRGDINAFTKMLIDAKVEPFEHRYF